MRSQFATANNTTTKVRFCPYAFTEHGILMLSNVLNSSKAISISIQIIRIFDKLRKYALSQSDTNIQITELRKLLMLHIENTDQKISKHEKAIKQILQVLDNLIEHPKPVKRIGFGT